MKALIGSLLVVCSVMLLAISVVGTTTAGAQNAPDTRIAALTADGSEALPQSTLRQTAQSRQACCREWNLVCYQGCDATANRMTPSLCKRDVCDADRLHYCLVYGYYRFRTLGTMDCR